jgi:hypothetical protein
LDHSCRRAVHLDPSLPPAYQLVTVPLMQKYSHLLTLPYTMFARWIRSPNADILVPLPFPLDLATSTSVQLSLFTPKSATSSVPPGPTARATLPPDYRRFPHLQPRSTQPSLFLSSPAQHLSARAAFTRHASQSRWFRSLFCLFSRYMWINDLERVVSIRHRWHKPPQVQLPALPGDGDFGTATWTATAGRH